MHGAQEVGDIGAVDEPEGAWVPQSEPGLSDEESDLEGDGGAVAAVIAVRLATPPHTTVEPQRQLYSRVTTATNCVGVFTQATTVAQLRTACAAQKLQKHNHSLE